MRTGQLRLVIAASAMILLYPLNSWSQQLRVFDCAGQQSFDRGLPGCDQFDPELLEVAKELAAHASDFAPHLPEDFDIDLRFNYSADFNYQRRAGQPHLITIGEGMMVHFWNSWVDIWNDYQQVDEDEAYIDYLSLLEWALYHEIGHALVEHSGYKTNNKDHETLADDFATVTMIRLYWQPDDDYVTPAELAAEGLYYLAVPQGQRATGKRNLLSLREEDNQEPERKSNKFRGVEGTGDHEPNPDRAWMIACLVYGAGQGPNPDSYQDNPDGEGGCSEGLYDDIVAELAEYYVPGEQYDH